MKPQTGDIALYRGAGIFGGLIRWYTKCEINHSAIVIVRDDGKVVKCHAARGWWFHRGFIEEPFELGEKGLMYVVRLDYDKLFQSEAIARSAIQNVRIRTREMVDIPTPYDWRAIAGIAIPWLGKYLKHSTRRFMCSEAVSWLWRPSGLPGVALVYRLWKSFFGKDFDTPHDDITPADILNSKNVKIIWWFGDE